MSNHFNVDTLVLVWTVFLTFLKAETSEFNQFKRISVKKWIKYILSIILNINLVEYTFNDKLYK